MKGAENVISLPSLGIFINIMLRIWVEMRRILSKIWQKPVVLTGLYLLLVWQAALCAPAVYLEKVDSTPDMGQYDGIGYLPLKGQGYCAPVAVSNSLMWLSESGLPDLAPSTGDRKMTQLRLASLLGEARYMKTDPDLGTSPTMVMIGLGKYLVDQRYPEAEVKYQGWRKHPEFFTTHQTTPSLDWIKEQLVGSGAVWLNIGWYNYDSQTSTYNRNGGHWLTVVGYGQDREGDPNPEMLIVHDPASKRIRTSITNRYVRARKIEPLSSGTRPTLTRNAQGYFEKVAEDPETLIQRENTPGLPRSAVGYLKLTGGLKMLKRADFAIVDGAVSLRMDKYKRGRRRH